jgi:hypothetical protein
MPEQTTSWREWNPCAISREQFEALLLDIRDGASRAVGERAVVQSGALLEDARDVWHTAEIALGILMPGYFPKREALDDMRRLLAWIDSADE